MVVGGLAAFEVILVDCGLGALEYEAELSGPSFIDGRSVAMRPYSVVANLLARPKADISRALQTIAAHRLAGTWSKPLSARSEPTTIG